MKDMALLIKRPADNQVGSMQAAGDARQTATSRAVDCERDYVHVCQQKVKVLSMKESPSQWRDERAGAR